MSGKKRKKLITISDIAKKMNISQNAVSLALNDKPGVSDTLKKAIKQCAKEMNYRGVIRKKNKRNNILVIIKDYLMADKWFYPSLYKGIEQRAINEGYNTILSSVTPEMDDTNVLPRIFYDIEFFGIIIIGIFGESFMAMVRNTGLPVVIADTYDFKYPFPSVVTDNIQGAFKLTEYLVSCGHKKIGFIGPYRLSTSYFDRFRGYVCAMQYYKLKIKDKYVILGEENPVLNARTEQERHDPLIDAIARLDSYPSAWICTNDILAIKVIRFLSGKGVKIPDDVSICGFDNDPEGELIAPALTTMNVQKYFIGLKAFELLLFILNSPSPLDNNIIITIQSDLVIRNSVAKIG